MGSNRGTNHMDFHVFGTVQFLDKGFQFKCDAFIIRMTDGNVLLSLNARHALPLDRPSVAILFCDHGVFRWEPVFRFNMQNGLIFNRPPMNALVFDTRPPLANNQDLPL